MEKKSLAWLFCKWDFLGFFSYFSFWFGLPACLAGWLGFFFIFNPSLTFLFSGDEFNFLWSWWEVEPCLGCPFLLSFFLFLSHFLSLSQFRLKLKSEWRKDKRRKKGEEEEEEVEKRPQQKRQRRQKRRFLPALLFLIESSKSCGLSFAPSFCFSLFFASPFF